MKITQAHLDANPDLVEVYNLGDEVDPETGIDPDKPCDKNNTNDPHYGQAGNYDKRCNWIPDIG